MRFGERVYPFRIRPQARALLRPLSHPRLALGEVGEARVRVVNLGNVPLRLPPKAVGVNVEVLSWEPWGNCPRGRRPSSPCASGARGGTEGGPEPGRGHGGGEGGSGPGSPWAL